MNNTQKIILELYDKQLFSVYEQKDLKCLAERDLNFNGNSIYSFYYDAISNCNEKEEINYDSLLSDMLNCSKDLKYSIGGMFLFLPYINNPLEQVFQIGDLECFPNYQNIYDRRYSIFSSIAAEKLYNYWDRIGDLLNAIFKVIDNERKVYFPSVVNDLPANVNESENYKWLAAFKDNDYIEFNNIRKNVVHYRQMETDYATKHLNILHDRKAMEKLQAEKESYPNFYKVQLAKSIEGFEITIRLIKEYNELLKNKNEENSAK